MKQQRLPREKMITDVALIARFQVRQSELCWSRTSISADTALGYALGTSASGQGGVWLHDYDPGHRLSAWPGRGQHCSSFGQRGNERPPLPTGFSFS